MQTEGAFAWWYVDLVDEEGRGLVLIWSFGLPFLPGARACPPAGERPSLSLAIYEGGESVFYALQTYEPGEASAQGGTVRLGASTLSLRVDPTKVTLNAELDLAVPGGGRLTGKVQARGWRCRTPEAADERGSHRWAPILVAQPGQARLQTDRGERFDVDGRVYVDSNGSDQPLHDLGIADWRWGRVAFPDRELIYYLVDPVEGPEAPEPIRLVLEARPDGQLMAREPRISWRGERRSIYGLGHHEQLALTGDDMDVRLNFRALVDDGPFYLRFLVDARDAASGERGRGVAERVVPDRIDRPWQRPFVRMRTHAAGGDNSMWLPLFSGPRRGRLERLWNHWRTGRGMEATR